MRFNFKKISAIGASILLAGMSMGFAAAANLPSSQFPAGNTVVVVSSNPAASTYDHMDASNISVAFPNATSGGGVPTGESVKLQMPSSYLHIGNGINQVFTRSVTSQDLPTLLADGTYTDSAQGDHSFTQKISVANLTLQQFDLSGFDYNVSETTPTIGFPLSSGDNVLNYTMTFQTPVNFSDMSTSTVDIMGTPYYVVSADSSALTLLNSAHSTQLQSGASATVNVGSQSYSVTATAYSNNKVSFTINGVALSQQLSAGETYKMSDGSYLSVQTVSPAQYAQGPSLIKFSIGSGKIVLNNDSSVTINGNSVNGLTSVLGLSGSKLNNIQLIWDAGDTTALTSNNVLDMPALGGVKLSFGGMTYPNMENTTVSNDGNYAVKLSTEDGNGPVSLDILGLNRTDGNYTTVGKDSNNLLVTNNSKVLNGVVRNNEFVVSWNNTKDFETNVYKVTGFNSNTSSSGLSVVLTPQDGGNSGIAITLANGTGSTIGLGNIVLTPSIDYAARTVNFTGNSGVSFDTFYTKDGLKVLLPIKSADVGAGGIYGGNTTGTVTTTSYPIQFFEAAKDGTLAGGSAFNITVGDAGSAGSYSTSVTNVAGTFSGTSNYLEIGNSQVNQYTVQSPLATTILYNQNPTQQTATVTYHGGESYGTVYLAASSASVSGGSSSEGAPVITDSEVSTYNTENMIVVGGSCINSAAATLVGGAYCGSAWTSATKADSTDGMGIGSGKFLIKSYAGSNTNGLTSGTALLVAGYDASGTVAATNYLLNNNMNLAAGQTYEGSTTSSQVTSVSSA